MSYTPGPWRLSESKGGQWFVYGADSESPFRPFVKLAKRHTKLEQANARLIAAAPELLGALEEILWAYQAEAHGGGFKSINARASAAIRKATEAA